MATAAPADPLPRSTTPPPPPRETRSTLPGEQIDVDHNQREQGKPSQPDDEHATGKAPMRGNAGNCAGALFWPAVGSVAPLECGRRGNPEIAGSGEAPAFGRRSGDWWRLGRLLD